MTDPCISLRGRRIVLTGAGGFLGSHLGRRLRAAGVDVVAFGRRQGFNLLADELPLQAGDHVFHLAGETGVPAAWDDPVQFHLVNAHGTVRVLDQCRRAGASMTYVGAYVYGVPRHLPIDEGHVTDANNPYAFSKLMAEQACEWFARIYDIPVTAIRLFNVYGPGQSDRFLIGRILSQVLDTSVVSIELMDLAPRRDYLFVDDAIDALVMSCPVKGYQLFNVGSGVSHSVHDVVDAVMSAASTHKHVVDLGQARPNEIPDVVADNSRITGQYGWSPRIDLESGIRRMIDEAML